MKSHSALILLTGKVYNVTRFLKYHPGRKAQLMRGAGVDCTEIYDKVFMLISISVFMFVAMNITCV